jgi:hypothetical protein
MLPVLPRPFCSARPACSAFSLPFSPWDEEDLPEALFSPDWPWVPFLPLSLVELDWPPPPLD